MKCYCTIHNTYREPVILVVSLIVLASVRAWFISTGHVDSGFNTYIIVSTLMSFSQSSQKDKKVVLSAKALETIYHTASSSIGKLISGKQYLGGYALKHVRDKVEVEGKELPFRKKKKLLQWSSGLAKTSSSAMEH